MGRLPATPATGKPGKRGWTTAPALAVSLKPTARGHGQTPLLAEWNGTGNQKPNARRTSTNSLAPGPQTPPFADRL
eukprot:11224292-Lingulodinium_polyedra.AAC.1